MKCKIEGCNTPVLCKGLCSKHYTRMHKHGNPNVTLRRANGEGNITNGYKRFNYSNRTVPEQNKVVEDILKKRLPTKAVVHHIDGDRKNNTPQNLVVCPDRAYHNLIHVRTKLYNFIHSEGKEDIAGIVRVGTVWKASIQYIDCLYLMGYFISKELAIAARLKAAKLFMKGVNLALHYKATQYRTGA